jgi:flagellar assembly protein FliH
MDSLQVMESAPQPEDPAQIEIFEYPAGRDEPSFATQGGWAGTEPAGESGRSPEERETRAGGTVDAGQRKEFDRRLLEETRRSFEAGREQGRQMERDAQAATQTAADERRVRQAAELIESFALERDRYLQAVEHEVVELALALAARILRREAQMDPLLLTGAVRVALGQLSGATEVRLRVPSAELDLWTETIALLPNLAVKPVVLAGDGMRLGDCAIETEMGSVDLGIRAQLGEIERGFFDRAGGHRAEPVTGADKVEGAIRENLA